tara:strand:+ start:2759 stop:2905 length:147 start_codon:yes stop_codon:yes gene_type:complete
MIEEYARYCSRDLIRILQEEEITGDLPLDDALYEYNLILPKEMERSFA